MKTSARGGAKEGGRDGRPHGRRRWPGLPTSHAFCFVLLGQAAETPLNHSPPPQGNPERGQAACSLPPILHNLTCGRVYFDCGKLPKIPSESLQRYKHPRPLTSSLTRPLLPASRQKIPSRGRDNEVRTAPSTTVTHLQSKPRQMAIAPLPPLDWGEQGQCTRGPPSLTLAPIS